MVLTAALMAEASDLTGTQSHSKYGFPLLLISYAIAVENRHNVVLYWLK